MVTESHWPAIALRLLLTVVAGGLLGLERSKTGHALESRTALAASLAMNALLLLF